MIFAEKYISFNIDFESSGFMTLHGWLQAFEVASVLIPRMYSSYYTHEAIRYFTDLKCRDD